MDNTVPTATNIQTTNAGTVGKAETGDTITYTFSEAMDPNSILALWTGASTLVTLHLNQAVTDTVTILNSANPAQLPIGSVSLGGTGFVTANRTFTNSTMLMSGSTITITLGTASGATTTQGANSNMVWTPAAAATDLAGNACALTAANEGGAADIDF
jgi:hypothetical protein